MLCRSARLILPGALLAALTACGPVQSTAFLLDAEVQIEAARTAQADKLAPYEWTLANLYIHKAREEVGYSDFEAAVDFARKASLNANEARKVAMGAENKDGASPSETPLP
ncbi:MAG: DUF4398 domain-containing protein [Myxococcota bacterium]|nr:DUF4398 domain-containing protein [Myxococcota bacterium]